MKIEGAGSIKGTKVEALPSQKPFELEEIGKTGKISNGIHKEKVKLSHTAELARELLEAARAAPDTRKDKIANIRYEIEKGTYYRSSQAIAEKIIKGAIELLKHSG